MQAYINWVNSQLRKRPGSRYVDDLQNDLRDGVAFLQLIEVVAKEPVPINEFPTSIADMKANVHGVLQFMAMKKIKMHQITEKEIVEGNLKSTMRLILALAAHFKPGSVRQPSQVYTDDKPGLQRTESIQSLAAEAAAALADASQAASTSGTSLHYKYRNRPRFDSPKTRTPQRTPPSTPPRTHATEPRMGRLNSMPEAFHSRSSSSASNMSGPYSAGTLPRIKPKTDRGLFSDYSSGRSTPPASLGISGLNVNDDTSNIRKSLNFEGRETDDNSGTSDRPRSMIAIGSELTKKFKQGNRPSSANSVSSVGCPDWDELVEDHNGMLSNLATTRGCLLRLQEVLLNGYVEDDEEDSGIFSSLEGGSAQEQLVVVSSRLDQRTHEYDQLKIELARYREDCVRLQGEKSGLQTRLSQQEQIIMDLKSELLRQELSCESANSAKDSAERVIEERERQITNLHEELAKRERIIENQKTEVEKFMNSMVDRENTEVDLHAQMALRENFSDGLRKQVEDISERMGALEHSEDYIQYRIAAYRSRLSLFEDAVNNTSNSEISNEFQKALDTIKNLRAQFGKHDPKQHSLDSIEQTIHTLVERISLLGAVSQLQDETPVNGERISLSIDSDKRSKSTATPRSSDGESTSKNHNGEKTKMLYFLDNSVTPVLKSIRKIPGDITLRDFKAACDRPGKYRYFFKSVDPDFGSVREELIFDDDVLPAVDGKIVAWIEDETLSVRTNASKHPSDHQEDLV